MPSGPITRDSVRIVDYTAEFADDYKRLNYEWIEQYFDIEPADRDALENPDKKVLQPGGHIYMALQGDNAVGTCALIRYDAKTFELAKMAVAPEARGQRIGWRLGQAIIGRAQELGGHTLYLESNSVLKPALHLYEKLGFRTATGLPSPYTRCNIQMSMALKELNEPT